jgi:hypothetical protein
MNTLFIILLSLAVVISGGLVKEGAFAGRPPVQMVADDEA